MGSFLENYFVSPNKNRVAIVGANSQGKTYQLGLLANDKTKKGKVIFVESETKSDENMKNSAEGTTLIEWITELVGMEQLNTVINDTIAKLNIKNENNLINVELKNSAKSYKGLIEFSMKTNSNKEHKSGAGERVLGQLIMIDNILNEQNNKYDYLIVDEPESHLHPALYYLIAKTLNNISHRGIKVAIATHSHEILKYFVEDSSEIIMMKDLEPIPLKETKYYYSLKNNYPIYQKEEFMMDSYKRIKDKDDLYFKNIIMSEIYKSLFSSTIILGEGVIEEELFNIYKNEYYKDFYENNVCTIVAHGKDMLLWYISILNDIGISNICLFDQDDENNPKCLMINNLIRDNAVFFKEFIVDGIGHKNNKIESYLKIPAKDSDKGKYNITELRYLYLKKDKKLLTLLDEINNMVKSKK